MKFKTAILTMALITSMTIFSGCASSSDISSSDESSKSIAADSKVSEKKKEKSMTQSEAADIAQEHIESKFARGDVIGGSPSAKSFGNVSYGEASCDYNSNSKSYEIKCKGTCWGYDSYGSVVDKYKFDGTVYVDAESGYASSYGFLLNKVY